MQALPGGPKPKANPDAMDTTAPEGGAVAAPAAGAAEAENVSETAKRLQKILSGEVSIELNLEFLFRNNKTDMVLLENIKVRSLFGPPFSSFSDLFSNFTIENR